MMSLQDTMAFHRNYISFHTDDMLNVFHLVVSDQYQVNCVQKYDHMLYQTLLEIFWEHHCTTSDKIKELLRAPDHTNQESIVKLILKKRPELGESFPKGEIQDLPLLWITVLFSYHNSAELLVRSGADVNELFGHSQSYMIDEKSSLLHVLLMMYPSAWNERLIHLITDYGANLQARDFYGRTPLHYAVKNGRIEVVEIFLEKGADANAIEDNGMTPLLTAASTSEAGVMLPLLMRHGADATARDYNGNNVLHWLTSNPKEEHVELAKVLIKKGVSLSDREYYLQYQPLHVAAQMGYNEMLKLYLDYGAKINVVSSYGEYPLTLTVDHYHKHQPVLETLLKRGADTNVRTIKGRTALHLACENAKYFPGMHDKIKALLSAGADVLAEDSDGNTPFALMQSENAIKRYSMMSNQLMLKALAIKKMRHLPTLALKDEKIIKTDIELMEYYRTCLECVVRMKTTKFIHTCTFFDMLIKNYCQIAELMRNREFKALFGMYDLDDSFCMYADDILEAFERAQKIYYSMLELEGLINQAVNDSLPHMVVRKIVRYVFDDCRGNAKWI